MSATGPAVSRGVDGFPPNLSAIADDTSGKYTDAQKAEAKRQRDLREFNAFGRFEAGAQVLGDSRPSFRAYISFLDQLSPAERKSARYAGRREETVAALKDAEKTAGQTPAADSRAGRITQAISLVAAGQRPAPSYGPLDSVLPSQALLMNLGSLMKLQIQQRSAAHNFKPLFAIPESGSFLGKNGKLA